MKLDKRIIQAINLNVKEITINEEEYNKLEAETKEMLKNNNIKINFVNDQKNFSCKF